MHDLDKLLLSDCHNSVIAAAEEYSPIATCHEAIPYLVSYHHFLRGNHDIPESFMRSL
jgi:hypothetical protein